MAEPNRAPASAASQISAPDPATSTAPVIATASSDGAAAVPVRALDSVEPHTPKLSKWRVPFIATLGAVFGYFIGTGLYGELAHPGKLLFIAMVTGAASYWFFDPLMELIYGWMGVPAREMPQDRRVFTTLAIIVMVLLIAGLHHSLGTAMDDEREGVSGFIYMLIVSFCTVGLTTLYWLRGARKLPPRVAASGARAGGIAGAAFGLIGLLGLVLQHKLPVPPSGAIPVAHYAGVLLGGIGIPSLLWLVPGLIGGLAIEKQWDKSSPTRGVLAALVAFALLFGLTAFIVSRSYPQYGNSAWLLALQFIPLTIGWGLGPFLQRESCDRAFSGMAPELAPAGGVLPRTVVAGSVVVPIDRDLDRAKTDKSAEVTALENAQIPPHVLLLKPTGSRAWALVVLMLTLAVGGWAYVSGWARTDPEIVSEIEGKFQVDSGLHGKPVNVQSEDRVVTISGSVENSIQHSAAVQEASSVRGVRQLIDQIQVTPPAPARPKTTAAQPAPQKVSTINATLNFFKKNGSQLHHPAQTQASSSAKPQSTHKSGGFFHFLKRNKKNTSVNE